MASESFQRQLHLAIDRHAHEHEQITARLLGALASACDNAHLDGRSIAQGLRDLGTVSPESSTHSVLQLSTLQERLQQEPHGEAAMYGMSGRTEPPSDRVKPSVSTQERDRLKRISGDISKAQKMMEVSRNSSPSKGYKISPRGVRALQRMGGKVGNVADTEEGDEMVVRKSLLVDRPAEEIKSIQTEFKVERLAFISPEGKVQRPKHEWAHMLGPTFARHVQAVADRFDPDRTTIGHGFFVRLVQSYQFKICSVLAITMNYFFIMVATDWRMDKVSQATLNASDPTRFRVIDIMFTTYYAVEVLLTIIALKGQFFFGFECSWNWFDLCIVLLSVMQEVLEAMDIKSIDTSFLRVLRFLRISKLLRMFEAMRMFKEVKIMVDSIAGSFMIFSLCVMMLALYCSIFAIFFVQAWTTKLKEDWTSMSFDDRRDVEKRFGSVMDAMISLFMALTGGQDWIEIYETIKELGTLYSILFFFFFLFALMSFFNVITGVFCEKAMSLARPGPREQMFRKQQKELRDATELINLLKSVLDLNEPFPSITASLFNDFLRHEEVIAYFEVRGLNVASAHRFFRVLADISNANEIDFPTFVSACIKMDGPASSIDLHVLDIELKTIQISLHHLHYQILDKFEDMFKQLQSSIRDSSPLRASRVSSISNPGTDPMQFLVPDEGVVRGERRSVFDDQSPRRPTNTSPPPPPSQIPMLDAQHMAPPEHILGAYPRGDPERLFTETCEEKTAFPEASPRGNVTTFHYV